MRTLWIISTSVGLFLSFNGVSSRAVQVGTTAQQQQQKEKDDSETKVSGDLGSKTNPVRCSGPPGERAYLNRLRCSDAKAPTYYRLGSYGKGPYGYILDGYSVKCEKKEPATVFMDMYHDHVEKEPVPGFTIVNDEP
jgi:hypothetical protein